MTPARPRFWLTVWEDAVRLIEEVAPSLAVFIMFLVILYQVFMRDVVSRPPTWADELARYLYIWMVFLGAAFVSRKHEHLRMDFLPGKLTGRPKALLLLIHEAAIIAFLVYALWSGVVFYRFYHAIPSPAMELASAYLVIVVPVACVLMLIHHMGHVVELIRSMGAR